MKQIKDLLTGEVFNPQRRNQKFSSARNRIMYNNNKAHEIRSSKAFIDKPLKDNHAILMSLIKPGEIRIISKEYLDGRGYNYAVLSHYEIYMEKNTPALYNFILTDMHLNKPSLTIFIKL